MSKLVQNIDKKAPQFFIPASYKDHQKTSGTSTKVEVAALHSNVNIKQGRDRGSPRITNTTKTHGTSAHPDFNNLKCQRSQDGNGNPTKPTSEHLLLASPSGMLDLSLYSYDPKPAKPVLKTNGATLNGPMLPCDPHDEVSLKTSEIGRMESMSLDKEKKRRRFRRPRRNSKVDRLIQILEDKRVGDDDTGEELEDLQLPRLRKVLNIIFVTLGVCFLLAVIIVILYTTIATDTEALNEACMHRYKEPESCNQNKSTTDSSTPLEENSTIISPSSLPVAALLSSTSSTVGIKRTSDFAHNHLPVDSDKESNRPTSVQFPNFYELPDVSISRIAATAGDSRRSTTYKKFPSNSYPWSTGWYAPNVNARSMGLSKPRTKMNAWQLSMKKQNPE